MKNTYSAAGVDIERGDRFAEFISKIPSQAVSRSIGGFAGGVELDWKAYREPLLMSSTDGVGTKILVARHLNKFDTLGQDLVAMCVNDLIVCGARPQVFLDYIAINKAEESLLHPLIKGIVEGCEQALCTLAGGETAEMPDLYGQGDFDLAGFSVGLVEKSLALPRSAVMQAGDRVFGLPSVGIHSNGLSLARKVLPKEVPGLWEEMLRPTKIYVQDLLKLLPLPGLLGAAHITGGGLEGNLKRILPPGLDFQARWDWEVPSIFGEIQTRGEVESQEMRRVFNMGVGIALVVSRHQADNFQKDATKAGLELMDLGSLSG